MRKVKFVSMFVLLALLLSAGPGAVIAQEPQPPDTPSPTEPTITESSRLEWVTVETEDGEKQVLVSVSSVESSQTANVSRDTMETKGATSGSAGGVIVTMWRSVQYYDANEPGPGYNYKVRTGARTQTDACVQRVFVHSKHKYWGPSGTYWGYDEEGSDLGGCKDDTDEQWGWWGPWNYMFAAGTTHQAVAVHEVEVNNTPYTWDGPDGKGERDPTVTL